METAMRPSVDEQRPFVRAPVVAGVVTAAAVAAAAALLVGVFTDDPEPPADVQAMCVEAERAWNDVEQLSTSGAAMRWMAAEESLDAFHDAAVATAEPVLAEAAGEFRSRVLALEDPRMSEAQRDEHWTAALDAFDEIEDHCGTV